jgi:GNAT superfamily N-acetyltransferase
MSDSLTLIKVSQPMSQAVSYLGIGRDADLERQLIAKSREANILKYTPKDAAQRFGDQAMLEKWLAKGREIHWLIGPDKDLAGIIWYGKSRFPLDLELPEMPEETFAIRIYDGYAGHGLARPFMTLSLQTAVRFKQERGEPVCGIWLQTDIDNPAAVAAYTKFGYQEVARDEKRVTMVLPSESILAKL